MFHDKSEKVLQSMAEEEDDSGCLAGNIGIFAVVAVLQASLISSSVLIRVVEEEEQ